MLDHELYLVVETSASDQRVMVRPKFQVSPGGFIQGTKVMPMDDVLVGTTYVYL